MTSPPPRGPLPRFLHECPRPAFSQSLYPVAFPQHALVFWLRCEVGVRWGALCTSLAGAAVPPQTLRLHCAFTRRSPVNPLGLREGKGFQTGSTTGVSSSPQGSERGGALIRAKVLGLPPPRTGGHLMRPLPHAAFSCVVPVERKLGLCHRLSSPLLHPTTLFVCLFVCFFSF